MSQPTVFKPIFLDHEGILARLADGSVINIGGVAGPFFTVGGRGILFDDGTSTGPSGAGITLQTVYNASSSGNGEAKIKLASGKDLIIADDSDDSIFFKIDSETGKVTITGDLEVLGSGSIIDTIIQDSDHWLISPKSGTTTALKIEPDAGVTPVVDLVTVRRIFGAPSVFRIDKDGNVFATQNVTISGLVNGIDLGQFKTSVDTHLDGTGVRHTASQIDITPIASMPAATNVQQALEAIDTMLANGGGTDPGNVYGQGDVRGYEHVQSSAASMWMVTHNKNTRRVTVALYDVDWQLIIPDTVKIMDQNTVAVVFGSAISGRAMLTLF